MYKILNGGRRSKKFSDLTKNKISTTQRIYNADYVLTVDRDGSIYLIKDRYGPPGQLKLERIIDLLSHILALAKFKGMTKVFEEGMKQELIKAIKKIVFNGGD